MPHLHDEGSEFHVALADHACDGSDQERREQHDNLAADA